jgi:hypothetical protein
MSTSGANLSSESKRPAREHSSPEASSLAGQSSPKRSFQQVVKSYFYWTYSRGSFHYDVMVTLILAFIFITPFMWDYGDKPASTASKTQPITVVGNGGHGLIITLLASDVKVPPDSSATVIKKALRNTMEPVLGDSVYIERWQVIRDPSGNPVSWKVWAHR